jgi:hypothetical protein
MVEIKAGNILAPMVRTSSFGGLSPEDLADLCVTKIIYVAESAPPAIREQAKLFEDHLKKVLVDYLARAAKSEKDRCIQICLQGGHTDAANLLRRV